MGALGEEFKYCRISLPKTCTLISGNSCPSWKMALAFCHGKGCIMTMVFCHIGKVEL